MKQDMDYLPRNYKTNHRTNPQEKLTYHLCDVLTAAKELLCTKETAEDSNEALYKFLKGLREVADDKTV